MVLERVESLRCDLQEVGTSVKEVSKDLIDLRLAYTGGHIQVVGVAEGNQKILGDHEIRIKKLEEVMSDFKVIKAAAVYIAGLVTTATFGLLWGIFTHKITLVL